MRCHLCPCLTKSAPSFRYPDIGVLAPSLPCRSLGTTVLTCGNAQHPRWRSVGLLYEATRVRTISTFCLYRTPRSPQGTDEYDDRVLTQVVAHERHLGEPCRGVVPAESEGSFRPRHHAVGVEPA